VQRDTASYDYIIVGAGSAGCVLAARLSEDPDVRVLLVEAGGRDRHPFLKVPLAWLQIARLDRYVWRFESEPEPTLGGRTIPFYRGRTLGGTSSVNGMIYARGHPSDYDGWRQMGLAGWGYADVLPYFRKLEASWRGAGPHHGAEGPVSVVQSRHPGFCYEALEAAAVTAGEPATDDLNAERQEGISRMELTIAHGARASASTSYLHPAMARANLTVLTDTILLRVLVERARAGGIEALVAGKSTVLRAERDVILSGGTYGSPQMMMLSGLGPANALRAKGIAPIADLPAVGQHLAEHVLTHVVFQARHRNTLLRALRIDRAALAALRWGFTRGGPLALNGVGANLYLRTRADLDRPDIRLICGALGPDARLWRPLLDAPVHRFFCGVNLLHPESRGSVGLRSADPRAAPVIRFNLLTAPADAAALLRGIRRARDIYGQPDMTQHIAAETAPGPSLVSDADLLAYLRRTASIGQHAVGTCRMGLDPGSAVVDADLRVHGIDGLRIVDASVMPSQIGGNPNVPVMMIAEKASDLLKAGS
jgi:choline dehydrogenase